MLSPLLATGTRDENAPISGFEANAVYANVALEGGHDGGGGGGGGGSGGGGERMGYRGPAWAPDYGYSPASDASTATTVSVEEDAAAAAALEIDLSLPLAGDTAAASGCRARCGGTGGCGAWALDRRAWHMAAARGAGFAARLDASCRLDFSPPPALPARCFSTRHTSGVAEGASSSPPPHAGAAAAATTLATTAAATAAAAEGGEELFSVLIDLVYADESYRPSLRFDFGPSWPASRIEAAALAFADQHAIVLGEGCGNGACVARTLTRAALQTAGRAEEPGSDVWPFSHDLRGE